MKKIIIVIIVLVNWILLISQTTIPAGNVSGNWLINGSPYLIEGEILIPDGETLTIDPGVFVEFQGHYKFNIQGQLLAIGTMQDSIHFTVNDTTGFYNPLTNDGAWDGIQFYETPATNDSSKIVYCKLEFSKTPTQEYTDWNGGAIYVYDFSKLLISNCLITNNRAQSGGGICIIENSNPILHSNIISNNIAYANYYSHGGGICIRNNSNPTLTNNTISNNSVTGGSSNYGGGIYIGVDSEPLLINNTIRYNATKYTGFGGGINIYSCNPTLISNLIQYNHTLDYNLTGGGIHIYYDDASPILINNVIANNSSRFGGAISYSDANPVLINNTLTNNTAIRGGAIYVYVVSSHSELTIVNSIMHNNQPQEIYFDSFNFNDIITITNSIIEGGQLGIVMNNGTVNWLEGNLDSDPFFENPLDDFHLQETSPAIGAGIDSIEIDGIWYYSPDIDIEGITRPTPIGSMPDIGAFENLLGEPVVEVNDFQFSLIESNISNYPNPFNPSTTIKFSIQNDSRIELSIYNIKGQIIKTLTSNEFTKGKHSIIWYGDDDFDNSVASGVYLYKLNVNGKTEAVKKCLLLK